MYNNNSYKRKKRNGCTPPNTHIHTLINICIIMIIRILSIVDDEYGYSLCPEWCRLIYEHIQQQRTSIWTFLYARCECMQHCIASYAAYNRLYIILFIRALYVYRDVCPIYYFHGNHDWFYPDVFLQLESLMLSEKKKVKRRITTHRNIITHLQMQVLCYTVLFAVDKCAAKEGSCR